MIRLTSLLLTLVLLFIIFSPAPADTLLIQKVAVVDPETELIATGQDIYINDDGIIQEIGLNLTRSADATLKLYK